MSFFQSSSNKTLEKNSLPWRAKLFLKSSVIHKEKNLFNFARKKIIENRENDNLLYEYVLTELESEIIIKGLWAKAIALAEGNEKKIEPLYMQYRVQNIKDKFTKLNIAYNDMKKEVLFNKIKSIFSEKTKDLEIITDFNLETKPISKEEKNTREIEQQKKEAIEKELKEKQRMEEEAFEILPNGMRLNKWGEEV